jgi:hypothetical protein
LPQQFLSLGELFWGGEGLGALQVEHDRRVLKEARAAVDLPRQLVLELRIAQHAGAHDHHRENRALNQIARHPQTGASEMPKSGTGLTPNPRRRNRLSPERAAMPIRAWRRNRAGRLRY